MLWDIKEEAPVFCHNILPESPDPCEAGRFSCYIGPDMRMPPDAGDCILQPGGENSPGEPMGPVTFHLRISLEAETFEVPWKAEYESGELPRLDYQLHILDNGDVESTYSLNP